MIEKEGRYQILSKIGSGGMSNVYKAWDTHLQMNVAIKEGIMDQSAEMNLLKNLKHPAIPRIIDHVNNLHHNSIVMEYVEGTTLAQWMEGKERIPVELVKQWILELCDILEYLHNNRPPILYLDLKPENIMIQEEGKLRLIDFGSVQYKYQIKKLSGTIGYAPKELINREKDKIDEQSDIYSLGMVFHYLLTGKSPIHPPFQREKVSYYQIGRASCRERVLRLV